MKCPICERPNPDFAPYCQACGADLKDPDVLALAGAGPTVTAPGAEASLASDRFLGVTAAGLTGGGHLRALAWLGGALLVIAFLVPIDPDWNGLRMSWALLGEGRSVAVILPLLLGAAAIELAVLGPRVPQVARGAFLVAAGAALVAFGIGPLALGAGAPPSPPWLFWAGALVAAIGCTARILRPLDRNARWVIAGGAALVVAGLVIPMDDARLHLPIEYALTRDHAVPTTLLAANTAGVGAELLLRFVSLWHLALAPAIVGALLLAMRRPSGPWDTKASGLRPLAWVIALYLPLSFGLYAFNILGYDYVWVPGHAVQIDVFTRAVFAGRARFALISLAASAWIIGGATALYLRYAPSGAAAAAPEGGAPTDGPTRTA